MSDVKAVLAAAGPFEGDAERLANFGARPLSNDLHSRFAADHAALGSERWPAARAGGQTLADRRDQGAANLPIRDRISGNVHLQKAHRAFDVHANRAGINMRRRDHDATDGRAVAGMGVGVEHQIGHAGREAGVDRLLNAHGVKTGADGIGADHGDRRAVLHRQNADGRIGCDNLRI